MIERNLSERYRLEGRIGQGGMAIVYGGVDTVLRRRVAIKVLRPELAADHDFVERFYTEAQHAAKLSHPNIVNIYDVGREGDDYFIVMELVDGATLGEMLERGRKLPEAVAIDFGAQICSGLAYAHRQGLLHRDVKPANILVTKDDVVKLSDFGIARAVTTQTMTMTQPGMIMGSVYYISPEQAQGHELHETSDLYSFGVVLYQMLAGALPYTADTPIAVALKHVSAPVPALDADDAGVSPALAAIVRKLLQKAPADRFASATEVAKALREAREHPQNAAPYDVAPAAAAPVAPRPRTIPNPKPRPSRYPDSRRPPVADEPARDAAVVVRRSPSGLVAVAAVALLLAIAAGYFIARPGGAFRKPGPIVLHSVVGLTVAEAERRLDSAGAKYAVVSVPSETVAANHVVRQDPGPRTGLPPESVVQLYVSTGLPTVQLIDVRQYSSDDAQRYLRNTKLVPKVEGVYDASPRGTVLSQKPAAGASVRVRSVVALVVSKGARPVYVPDVVSMPLAQAQAAVEQRHLKFVVGDRNPSDSIPADVVTSQNPAPGSALDPDSTVSVVASSGPPQLAVPGVTGRDAATAQQQLQAAGLPASIQYLVTSDAPSGTVLKQTPNGGTKVRKGTGVTLAVAVPGMVPDVAGKSPADAQAALQSAGYRTGNTAYVQEGADGTVARTEPAAGSTLTPGETVMLYVNGTSSEGDGQ